MLLSLPANNNCPIIPILIVPNSVQLKMPQSSNNLVLSVQKNGVQNDVSCAPLNPAVSLLHKSPPKHLKLSKLQLRSSPPAFVSYAALSSKVCFRAELQRGPKSPQEPRCGSFVDNPMSARPLRPSPHGASHLKPSYIKDVAFQPHQKFSARVLTDCTFSQKSRRIFASKI